MAKRKDKARDERIMWEIVPDAHDSEERAMGWWSHLQDTLSFSFTAHCTAQRSISPLRKGDEVEVIGMAPEDECKHEMFVMIRWDRKEGLAVPLSQLKVGGDADEATRQAVEDWLYWVKQGYEL